jgi:DNA-binding transcriptional regulator YhcF (GntR family)
MKISWPLGVNVHSPVPIRWQLSEQLKHVIERGGVQRDQALPSIRELAGFLRINPNTVARAIEDLKRGGYVETRRGKGVFVTTTRPPGVSPALREDFLKDAVIRAAALGMTPQDAAVGILSLAAVGLPGLRTAAEILLVECSESELDFFGRELQAQLPVRVDKCSSRTWRRPCVGAHRFTGRPRSPALGISRRWNAV